MTVILWLLAVVVYLLIGVGLVRLADKRGLLSADAFSESVYAVNPTLAVIVWPVLVVFIVLILVLYFVVTAGAGILSKVDSWILGKKC